MIPDRTPVAPKTLSEFAAVCLRALMDASLGHCFSIGGAVGLSYYHPYRMTNDLDAWWEIQTGEPDRQRILHLIEVSLNSFGETNRRAWGDVVSVELLQERKVVFSVQIAQRSARLNPSLPINDGQLLIDSLDDLVASKMVALIERGAPRDFRDIHALCAAGLANPEDCWQLWRRRQTLAGSDANPERARLALETHLARIALHRPLEKILSLEQKTDTQKIRAWFAGEFLDARASNSAE